MLQHEFTGHLRDERICFGERTRFSEAIGQADVTGQSPEIELFLNSIKLGTPAARDGDGRHTETSCAIRHADARLAFKRLRIEPALAGEHKARALKSLIEPHSIENQINAALQCCAAESDESESGSACRAGAGLIRIAAGHPRQVRQSFIEVLHLFGRCAFLRAIYGRRAARSAQRIDDVTCHSNGRTQ